jgi:hypothetical protein
VLELISKINSIGSTFTPELLDTSVVVVVEGASVFRSAGAERIWELMNTKARTIDRSAKSHPAKLLFCRRFEFDMIGF